MPIDLTGKGGLIVDGLSGGTGKDPQKDYKIQWYAVWADCNQGAGLLGSCNKGFGVAGSVGDPVEDRWSLFTGVPAFTTQGGVFGSSKKNAGVLGVSNSNIGVFGVSETDDGIVGSSKAGNGVSGFSDLWTGVYGGSNSDVGVYGVSWHSSAVYGYATDVRFDGKENHIGVTGESNSRNGTGVFGNCSSDIAEGNGVWGVCRMGTGVRGESDHIGVSGESTQGIGVSGESEGDFVPPKPGPGPQPGPGGAIGQPMGAGFTDRPAGVTGTATGNVGIGVHGQSVSGPGVFGYSLLDYAGYFAGKVHVSGSLVKAGGGFKIDHPQDPANRYLNHAFVESPDMKNIYDGVAVLNGNGEAVVELPKWFQALNKDFRYQLTAIGGPGPGLHIAQGISNNRFKIAGGKPRMKVSWQITGIRQDAWAKANSMPVEEKKPERGRIKDVRATIGAHLASLPCTGYNGYRVTRRMNIGLY